ncbi:hypothetical protein [Paraburkholderia sp. RL18-085-BIA-A]
MQALQIVGRRPALAERAAIYAEERHQNHVRRLYARHYRDLSLI